MSLFGNFLAIGCPGREDTWLHTGKVATDWEGEDVGAVYLYRRDTAEGAFSFFQVSVGIEQSRIRPWLLQLSPAPLVIHAENVAATTLRRI